MALDKSPLSTALSGLLFWFLLLTKWTGSGTVPPTQSPCLATIPPQHPAHSLNMEGVQCVFRGREELNVSTTAKRLPLLRISGLCPSFFALMFLGLITLLPKTQEIRGFLSHPATRGQQKSTTESFLRQLRAQSRGSNIWHKDTHQEQFSCPGRLFPHTTSLWP